MSSKNLLPYENLQKLKIDYDNMQEELMEKLRSIDELLQNLNNDNHKWIHFNDEFKRLETLFREISSMFDAKMFGERTLEEKQEILEVIIFLIEISMNSNNYQYVHFFDISL